MENAFLLVFALMFLIVGTLIILGKGDSFIKCLRRKGAEQYNVARVRILNALTMFSTAVFFVALYILMPEVMKVQIAAGVELFIVVIIQILNKTWAKRF